MPIILWNVRYIHSERLAEAAGRGAGLVKAAIRNSGHEQAHGTDINETVHDVVDAFGSNCAHPECPLRHGWYDQP